ncbi:MAG TPA: NAD(P)-binding domain-containing protein [Candidatus Binataceae bacterium]|nr:NAD(P)-binding domain-containing protein [Candidatus Binataceae bacterium]
MTRRRTLIVLGCTALLLLGMWLALHQSYSPGELLKGHQSFASNCAACHQPWRGVPVASTECVDCHGQMPDNPHSGAKVSDTSSGIIAGKTIASFHDGLACMSCHTDHVGRVVNLADVSGGNCAWCHQHDSIDDVSAHRRKPMLLNGPPVHIFEKDFSHHQHLQDTIDHLQKAQDQAQKMRSPERKKEAEAQVAALRGVLDSSGQHLQCKTCHVVRAWTPTSDDKFSIAMAGCTVSGCHAGWRDEELKLTDAAPQYAAQQSPDTPQPTLIDYVAPAHFQFVKAIFAHSAGHLRSNCADCHTDIENSAKPGDFHSKRVSNCFACHAHQPAKAGEQARNSAVLGVQVAMAAVLPPSGEKKVTGCAECHAFHLNYKGAEKVKDFPNKAPTVRPHPEAGLQFAAYAVHMKFVHGSMPQVSVRPESWRPWGVGVVAIVVLSGLAAGYVRYFPREVAARRARSGVAPQRTAEVPALDDAYQSSVPGLYVVGETAGTASINLAMRSGRQAVEFVAGALKGAAPAPEVYDIAIVGCGPAGIGATTTAKSRGLNYIALEKTTAASTIRNYPRGKFVQSTPIDINEYGSFMMEGDNSKEGLVKKWEEMVAATRIAIEEREEVTAIKRAGDVFEVGTASGKNFRTRYVVLAIGVRGSPRKLGVPGEAPDRVFYNLIEPEEFKGKRILVVGGGNAGAEVTQALANPDLGNTVSYSFRDVTLGPPVTPENADKITALEQQNLITAYPFSQVTELKPGKVVLAPRAAQAGPKLTAGPGTVVLTEPIELENDVVFAMLGADLPTRLMKSFGIRMTRKGH